MIVENLALNFGGLADSIEVLLAVIFMLGGIYITYKVQQWADRAGEQPPAANSALGGSAERYEGHGIRR
jgi:hypothetical protein